MSLEVRVVADGEPVEGAVVEVHWRKAGVFAGCLGDFYGYTTATTDSAGLVHATLDRAGHIRLSVEKVGLATGFATYTESTPHTPNDRWPRVFMLVSLEPETLVRGTVVDANGAPFTEGAARVVELDESASLDEKGGYVLHGLGTNEDYHVEILGGGERMASALVRLRESGTFHEWRVFGAGRLSARYVAPDLRGVPPPVRCCAFLIERLGRDGHFYPETRLKKTLDSPHDGVDFTELSPGTYRVSMRAGGVGAGTSEPVVVSLRQSSSCKVALRRGRSISGSVMRSNGEPIAAARVGLGADDPAPATSDASGAFSLENAPDEDVVLTASCDGFESTSFLVPRSASSVDAVMLLPE